MKSVQDFDPEGFRAAYEELGLTQLDVANAIGVSPGGTVGRWVRRRGGAPQSPGSSLRLRRRWASLGPGC